MKKTKLWKLALVAAVILTVAIMGVIAVSALTVTIEDVTINANGTITVDYTLSAAPPGHQTTIMVYRVTGRSGVPTVPGAPGGGPDAWPNTPGGQFDTNTTTPLVYVNQIGQTALTGSHTINSALVSAEDGIFAIRISGTDMTVVDQVGAAIVDTRTPLSANDVVINRQVGVAGANVTLTATGGIAPYTFAVTAGTLPGWLTLEDGVLVTSNPVEGDVGTDSVTMTVTDNAGATYTFTVTWNVTLESPGLPVDDVIFVGGNDAFAANWLDWVGTGGWQRVLIQVELTEEFDPAFAPNVAGVTGQYWFWSPELHAFDGLVQGFSGNAAALEAALTWDGTLDGTIEVYGAPLGVDEWYHMEWDNVMYALYVFMQEDYFAGSPLTVSPQAALALSVDSFDVVEWEDVMALLYYFMQEQGAVLRFVEDFRR